ncbi:DUF4097 family beta strand repeat-containing protein [Cellulosimicrobium marinum]|uniref:DUF4097 family beta strand repeat-containing protein n=1 Tax=Cellulosimicrobium marinum TaxID=1638992 RepID=UPI001E454E57|nr:DUF4097 family beta strand repeat-containing protein [Cellulosimicrobium marinum]MCB7138084.1 DUF4097 family beta strand repeat-containing protein [Cellulosimicrobium marinum]
MSTETWVIATPQTVDVADVRRVVVQLTDGSVDVVAEPGRAGGAHVEVGDVSDRPLQVSVHDGELRVGYDFAGIEGLVDRAKGLRDKDRAVVRLTVPADATVRVSTARGAASVTGTTADLSVTTATGPVRVSGATGPVSVKTASAPVDVVEHVGDVRVSTASGAVNVTGSLGRVAVTTVTSGVEVVARESTPLVDARTVSGDVAVRLGAGAPVNLKARSVTGKAVLDGVRLESSAQRTTSVDHVDRADSAQGAGGAYVSASTVSGDLTVSRG